MTDEDTTTASLEPSLPARIFEGDYSVLMWSAINSAETVEDLRSALYLVCCRLQELEAKLDRERA